MWPSCRVPIPVAAIQDGPNSVLLSVLVPSKDKGHGEDVSFPAGAPSLPILCSLGTARGSVEPAWPVPLPSQSVLEQVAWERGTEARGDALGGGGTVGALWHLDAALVLFSQGPAPQSSVLLTRAPCLTPACWRRVRGLWGLGETPGMFPSHSCVPSIPTLPVSPPSHSTAMCPLHACVSLPSQPLTSPLLANHQSVPSIPTVSSCSFHPNPPYLLQRTHDHQDMPPHRGPHLPRTPPRRRRKSQVF